MEVAMKAKERSHDRAPGNTGASLSLPKELYMRAKARAKADHRTFVGYVRMLLEDDLRRRGDGSDPTTR